VLNHGRELNSTEATGDETENAEVAVRFPTCRERIWTAMRYRRYRYSLVRLAAR
jgi:hypothetical protein